MITPDDITEILGARSDNRRGGKCDQVDVREYGLLEELRFIRREAQAEANLAYEDWSSHPSVATYAVYLAAQDRADAAQDALGEFSRHLQSSRL